MTHLDRMSAEDQAKAIRTRQLSPVELVDHYIDRIADLNDRLGAFITFDADQTRAAAQQAEQRLMASPAEDLPPLFGVPISIKDTWPVAGLRCTAGSAAFADRMAPMDAVVVQAIRRAGAIVLGKTNAAEFGCSSYTDTVYGLARSPYDLARSAGGSSGGAAAAVSAGLGALALGSDGGGSIRIPAACCGIVGLKPTRGRVTAAPGPDAAGLATAGPMARTVADAALLLDVMSVTEPGDTYRLAPTGPGHFRQSANLAPRALRIGVMTPTGPVDPACTEACDQAARLLDELGHQIEVAPPAGIDDYVAEFATVWSLLAASVAVPEDRERDLLPFTRWLRSQGRTHGALTMMSAQAAMLAASRRVAARYDHFDVLISTTLAQLPPPVGSLMDENDYPATFAKMLAVHPLTPLWNITGQPSMNLPLHWTSEGMPVGIMLTGRHGCEDVLIALAAQLERARPWWNRWPTMSATKVGQ